MASIEREIKELKDASKVHDTDLKHLNELLRGLRQ